MSNLVQRVRVASLATHRIRSTIPAHRHSDALSRIIVGMDSFAAFEEVLYLAKQFRCDMVLIAGDLFHDNRPSRRTLYITMEIIRRYCMGPDPVRIQIVSDQAQNFRNVSGTVNYQDDNYSVDLPIFSIHGNHDDPTRDSHGELLAALDLLAVSNLVNYFGRQEQVDQVEISPVLIQKGATQLALYGMGSMRDERLNRMWQGKKVRFLRPADDDNDNEHDTGFFNLFTLHQNRDLGRGSKNCVQESMIPEWMDLVVWGHEHECLIEFSESVVGTFRITQPGSSVATSLVAGEAVRKKVGVVDVQGKNFRMHTVPLTQVRSFVTAELSLQEHRANLDPDDPKIDDKVTNILEEQVRVLVLNAREKRREILRDARAAGSNAGGRDDDPKGMISPLRYTLKNPDEVLVRIKVDHSNGFLSLNNQRFGARFVGDVANPSDILLFHRRKDIKQATQQTRAAQKMMQTPIAPEELEQTHMEDIVKEFLTLPEQKLKLLNETRLSEAMEEFVDKSLTGSINEMAFAQLKQRQKKLHTTHTASTDIDTEPNVEPEAASKSKSRGSTLARQSNVASTTAAATEVTAKKRRRTAAAARAAESSDEDSVEKSPVRQLTRNGKENHRKGRLEADRHGESDDDALEEVPPTRPDSVPPKQTATSRSTDSSRRKATRRQQLEDEDDLDEQENDRPAPRASAPSRPARQSRTRVVRYHQEDPDDEDSDSGVEDMPRAGNPVKTTQRVASGRQASTTLRSTAGRGRRAMRSSFGSDGSDEDSADDEYRLRNTEDLDDDWGTAATRSQL
jgi:double-strand break repair protein MRE11